MENIILSTSDNPYDPFTEWDKWWAYDVNTMGYNTSGLVARISPTSNALSDEVNNRIMCDAIKRYVKSNPTVIGYDNVYYVIKHEPTSNASD